MIHSRNFFLLKRDFTKAMSRFMSTTPETRPYEAHSAREKWRAAPEVQSTLLGWPALNRDL